MSRANRLPKGALPYIFNPRNKRVMIATPEKLARVDEYDKPYFIPCDSPEGPGEPKVETAKTVADVVPPVEAPKADDKKAPEVKGSGDLLDIVMTSEDKDQLVQIGKDMDVKLTRAMNISTMQNHLSVKLAELAALQ